MSDISVALDRIQSLERAVQTPFTGNPIAFLEMLSGHLEGSAVTAAVSQEAPATSRFEPADLLLLDGVMRARFTPAAVTGTGQLLRPVDGNVSSPFGERIHPLTGERKHHDGVDFADPLGTPIRAAAEGVVSFAGERNGYGNVVIVDHPGGLQTLYAHQSRIGVTEGEHVGRGQIIGAVGATGHATGPHLHFEVRQGGRAVDPMPYL